MWGFRKGLQFRLVFVFTKEALQFMSIREGQLN